MMSHDQDDGELSLETDKLLQDISEESDVVGRHTDIDKSGTRSWIYDDVLDYIGLGKYHWILLLVMGWTNCGDAVEVLCVSFLLPSAECELRLTSQDKGWLNASIFLGMMIGGYVWAVFADMNGRRKTLISSLVFNAVFGALSSFARSFEMLLVLRFLSGIGVGGNIPIAWAYFVEFQPRQKRGRMLSLMAGFWMIGNVLVALLAWAIIPHTDMGHFNAYTYSSWRVFILVCTVPPITSAVLLIFLPESPKWLLENGKEEQCLAILAKMYAVNHGTEQGFNVAHVQRSQAISDISHDTSKMRHIRSMGRSVLKCRELFTPALARRTIIYTWVNIALAFGYYGLWMWFPELFKRLEESGRDDVSVCTSTLAGLNSSGEPDFGDCSEVGGSDELYINSLLVAASSLPGNVIAFAFMDTLGRRWLLAGSMVTCSLLVFFIWFIKNKLQNLILSCLFSAVSIMAWNSIDVLGTELFPTGVRATAFGFSLAFARVGAIMGNVVFGQLIDVNCTIPILLVVGFLSVGGLSGLLFPDTIGIFLE
ncbi:PREDICTED: synaptic vesicle glycoprotein 2C-like [Priapulus caudatus]|uniref:Synaptic vesicle glycoprotein 2C-like n=1 Tax=Priapulus caudatus TaxID=37621 RepID=A0ABM1EA15_PRICU|nr:PREDICTED: synaptic vesicle glycoprotein 2C-like [Priapulus caudatus]